MLSCPTSPQRSRGVLEALQFLVRTTRVERSYRDTIPPEYRRWLRNLTWPMLVTTTLPGTRLSETRRGVVRALLLGWTNLRAAEFD